MWSRGKKQTDRRKGREETVMTNRTVSKIFIISTCFNHTPAMPSSRNGQDAVSSTNGCMGAWNATYGFEKKRIDGEKREIEKKRTRTSSNGPTQVKEQKEAGASRVSSPDSIIFSSAWTPKRKRATKNKARTIDFFKIVLPPPLISLSDLMMTPPH